MFYISAPHLLPGNGLFDRSLLKVDMKVKSRGALYITGLEEEMC